MSRLFSRFRLPALSASVSVAVSSVAVLATTVTQEPQTETHPENKFESKVPVPDDAPEALKQLFADNKTWWTTTPDRHFDISQHFIYTSLFKSGVIQQYFYFVERTPSPSSALGPELRIVYKLGKVVCGHDGSSLVAVFASYFLTIVIRHCTWWPFFCFD